jgi:hypothetical protein
VPDPDTVAAALARLVNGTDGPPAETEDNEPPPARVVADAEAALDRLPTAARFVADGGEQRLQRVVESGAVDDQLANRGRAVLTALSRLRAATSPDDSGRSVHPADGDDHFHRGRTTLLKGAGVATER